MSAFIVEKALIDALLLAGLNIKRYPGDDFRWYFAKDKKDLSPWRELTRDTAAAAGQMLLDENIRSVSGRYPDSTPTHMPGPTNAYWLIPYKLGTTRPPTVVQALKLVNCYEYQACESDDWKKTEAYAFCYYLKEHIICCLPGYEQAPWGWPPPPKEKPAPVEKADIKVVRVKTWGVSI